MMRRLEYPNPQFQRPNFRCLNGTWQFRIDGVDDESVGFCRNIEVPFCPESKLSGVGYTDFITNCKYRKLFEASKPAEDERLVLNFGAVDYEATVYVNGNFVGKHRGGYTPFGFDIAPYVVDGENEIIVEVHDDVRENLPSGKQSSKKDSYGCFYTRSTGIWQSVYLERTPANYVRYVKYFPHIDTTSVDIEIGLAEEGEVEIIVSYEGREVARGKRFVKFRNTLSLDLSEKHLWEPGNGRLYDVEIRFGDDIVKSYFGLREVCYEGDKFLINGKSVYQRLVLDQGYYPDGIYTAPTEEDLINDIKLSFELGFNGARLHQKVFEPRFLYHCDKLGYMVWGEFPSWGANYGTLDSIGAVIGEWTEAVERDFNHPSIITWCPLNETWEDLDGKSNKVRDQRYIDAVYETTKCLDSTRPCVDVSGGYHGKRTDLFDFHCYHSPDKLREYLSALVDKGEMIVPITFAPDWAEEKIEYKGEPVNASEYGGVSFATDGNGGWGYRASQSEDSFVDEYVALTEQLVACKKLSGFCYTQLYDVEQEQNGLLTYTRKHKFSEKARERIVNCNRAHAPIED